MFGRARKKATQHTIGACRPLVGIVQQNHGLPLNFWDNEFVLGFFYFIIGFHASHTSGQNLSAEDKGRVLFDTFSALSNLNGVEIARRCQELQTQDPKCDLFERGLDNATMVALQSVGALKRDQQTLPWLEKAEQMAVDSGQPGDMGAIGGNLMLLLYYNVIKQQFDTEEY